MDGAMAGGVLERLPDLGGGAIELLKAIGMMGRKR